MVKEGTMLGYFPATEYIKSAETSGDLNKLVKIDFGGKAKCVNATFVVEEIENHVRSCISGEKADEGAFMIKVTIGYQYGDLDIKDKQLVENYKARDQVKKRRYAISLAIDGSTCKAYMRERTYVPIDGTKEVPSTVGDLGCTVINH
jgi:hypothetical protein